MQSVQDRKSMQDGQDSQCLIAKCSHLFVKCSHLQTFLICKVFPFDCKPFFFDCKPFSFDCKTSSFDCKPLLILGQYGTFVLVILCKGVLRLF